MATQYRVTAPVVICKAQTADGIRWIDIQQGGLVPAGTEEQWVAAHLEKGMIAPVPGTEPPRAPAPEPKAEPEPKQAAQPHRGAAPKAGG